MKSNKHIITGIMIIYTVLMIITIGLGIFETLSESQSLIIKGYNPITIASLGGVLGVFAIVIGDMGLLFIRDL